MEAILYYRQKITGLFMRNEFFLMPLIKFITMMAILLIMNWHLGYRLLLMRWILVILVSLICALLPWPGITALAALYLAGHVSALTWEGTAILLVSYLAFCLLHYLFLPGGSVIVLLLPLAFYLDIPYLVPILAGLFGSSLAFLPVGEGVALYYLMMALEKNAAVFSDPAATIVTKLLQITKSLNNQEMFLMLIIFCAATLAVHGISRLSVDHAYSIAAAVGGVLIMIAILLGSSVLSLGLSAGSVILWGIVCTLIAVAVALWGHALDYSSIEYLEYEDDDYVYYVKAVPKMKIAEEERVVYDIADDEVDYEETPGDDSDEYYEE